MSDSMNIYQRMSKASGMCEKLAKDGVCKMGTGGYKYTSHDAYVAMVRPLLIECGVYVSFSVSGDYLSAWFTNIERHDDRFESVVPLVIPRKDPQAVGAALSYAKKYILALNLMIETGDDADSTEETKRNTKAADDAAKLKAQCKNLCTALQLDKDAVNALWAECGKDYNVYLDALNDMADKVTDEEANTMKEAGQ